MIRNYFLMLLLSLLIYKKYSSIKLIFRAFDIRGAKFVADSMPITWTIKATQIQNLSEIVIELPEDIQKNETKLSLTYADS